MAYEEYVAVGGIFIILIVSLLMIALKLSQEHSPIKLFLIWVVTFLIIPMVVVIQSIAVDLSLAANISTILNIVLYISIMIAVSMSVYFMVYILGKFLFFAATKNKSALRT